MNVSKDGAGSGSTGRRITEKLSADALRERTGRDWGDWFSVLDAWDATRHTHAEIAAHLRTEHGMDGWYAQSVTVGYEQERGLRQVGQSSTGDWRTSVRVTALPDGRTQLGLAHEKLAGAEAVATYRAFWKDRLNALKALLEQPGPS
ncbi:DUF4287 domain-containing protein [Streptomyces sp. NPDC002346]